MAMKISIKARCTVFCVFVMTATALIATASCYSSDDEPGEKRQPKSAGLDIQSQHDKLKRDLRIQFRNDFSRDDASSGRFDKNWTKLQDGQSRMADGQWLLELLRQPPPGPGEMLLGGFGTTTKYFNPQLTGTNGVEVTIVSFSHEDYDQALDKPGQLVQAWSMTLGSWRGMVGGQEDKQTDRGVQLHFDLLRDDGLYIYLVRGLLPEDYEKYPKDGYSPGSPSMTDEQKRASHIEAAEKGEIFISAPCLCLATRVYRSEQEIDDILGRSRRYGLYLTDDAKSVYWTLDDKVMDKFDITGYFASSPESVRDGAYLSIAGVAGYQQNRWTMDDLEIRVSP